MVRREVAAVGNKFGRNKRMQESEGIVEQFRGRLISATEF